MKSTRCEWTLTDWTGGTDLWETDCGCSLDLIETPKKAGMVVCPFCGRELFVKEEG